MKKELLKNKIVAILLLVVGYASKGIEGDGTFFFFSVLLAIELFASRENAIL